MKKLKILFLSSIVFTLCLSTYFLIGIFSTEDSLIIDKSSTSNNLDKQSEVMQVVLPIEYIHMWQGNYHRENDHWSFEVREISSKGFIYEFNSAYKEHLTGEACFSEGSNYLEAYDDNGLIFIINCSNPGIDVKGSEELKGFWEKQSALIENDLIFNRIKLGMSYEEVAQRLNIKEKLDFDIDANEPVVEGFPIVTNIIHDGIQINFGAFSEAPNDAIVIGIGTADDKFSTMRGAKVGCTQEQVIELYGVPDIQENNLLIYILAPWEIYFTFEDNRLVEIFINSEFG